MIGDPERLRGNRQRRIDGRRRRQKRGVDYEQIGVVEGATVWVERRRCSISSDADGAALMRRRTTVERLRQHDWIAGGTQPFLEGRDQREMRHPIRPFPVESNPGTIYRHSAL